MKIGALSREIRDLFRAGGIETADLDARLLVAEALDLTPSDIILKSEETVPENACRKARGYAGQRLRGTPVGRILGHREFWGLDLKLNDDTLEPRPDTEILVEAVLERSSTNDRFCFADIGTGTGAIAIALLAERRNAIGIAVDISELALECACENASRYGVDNRLLCVRSNYCDALGTGFDWIVSNPPYIRTSVMAGLSREVREHDPKRALDGGLDGLDAYRAIIRHAGHCLAPSGRVALEIGFDQADSVSALLTAADFLDVEIIQDLAGNDRILVAELDKAALF